MDNIQYDDFDFENENRIKKQLMIQNILAVFSVILAVIYLAVSVTFLANNYNTIGDCSFLWWYNLLSLLIPIELMVMVACCKCNLYNSFVLVLLIFLGLCLLDFPNLVIKSTIGFAPFEHHEHLFG